MNEREKGEKETKAQGPDLSRRGFLKTVGSAGAAAAGATTATAMLPLAVEAAASAEPKGVREAVVALNVNGKEHRVPVRIQWTLLEVLRREIGFTGTKKGCDRGSCGACTVIADGKAIYACSVLAVEMEGKKIVTVEGLAEGEKLHPIQRAFSEHGGYQCGYCTSGQMMSTKALLDRKPKPTADDVKAALAGNICRCGAYPKILASVLAAAEKS